MVSSRATELYRRDARARGKELTVKQREELMKPYLPEPPKNATNGLSQRTKSRQGHKKRVRPLISYGLHFLLYHTAQIIFGIFTRVRQTYRALFDRILGILYYHHRTPELIRRDVKALDRLPEHLSVILHLRGEHEGGLERLLDEVAELSAWCASAGIPMLSVYETPGRVEMSRPPLTPY